MLGGELGEKYGTEHEYYNLRSPAEAIKLLCINYPALQKDLTEAHHNGIGYKVIQGGAAMGYDELALPFGSRPLMVVPVISGSGGSTGQILLGVGLVAFSILTAGAGAGFLGLGAGLTGTIGASGSLVAGSFVLGSAASVAIGSIGASLILSGTANLISPQPEVPRLGRNRLDGGTNVRGTGPQGNTRGASNDQSYAFTGPTNTVGTGATIPVIYGRVITGGHLLSLDIDVSDDSDPLRETLGGYNRSEVRINDERIKNKFTSSLDDDKLKTKRLDDPRTANFTTDKNRRVFLDATFGPGLNQLVEDESSKLSFRTKESAFKFNDILYDQGHLKYKKDIRNTLDVLFKLENSFYDYVAGEDSTIIDAFISYRINIRFGGLGNSEAVFASAGVTLQGKFKSNSKDPFLYGHRLELPKSGDANKVKLEVAIKDASVANDVSFTLVGYGYGLLG